MSGSPWIRAAAAVMLLAAPARGGTWTDWLEPAPNAPLTANFCPGWVVKSSTQSESGRWVCPARWEEFLKPNRGYEGELVFSLKPGKEAPPGPLIVRLLHSVAEREDMNWPDGDEVPEGFAPDLLPAAAPRRPLSEETRTASAEFPLRVPVVLPRPRVSYRYYRSKGVPALVCGYEVLDSAGRILCRGALYPYRLSGPTRLLAGTDEADGVMTEKLADWSGAVDFLEDLPGDMLAYRDVQGIWFTDQLWEKMDGREPLIRRLLLSGVQLSGGTTLVERIRSGLHTGWDGRAVAGVVAPHVSFSQGDFSLRELNLNRPSGSECGDARDESVFENEVNLFAADRNAYLYLTLAGLIVFSAGVAVILIVIFARLKGERRVVVWWLLPAWSAFCFAAILAGGLMTLSRRPRADVTEYRLVMQGWPEMHCRAVASAMTFTPGRPEWKLPPGAVIYDPRNNQLDGWWERIDAEISAEEMRLWLPRKMAGKTIELEAGWFEPASAPVALEDSAPGSGVRLAVASEDLDGVFVLAEGKWRDLGTMRAGERLAPLAVESLEENRVAGLPLVLHGALQRWHRHEMCSNPEHNHPPAEDGGASKQHDWVVVAWKRDVPPRAAPTWADSLTKGRVIWVIQWP